jgi:hypothetical protein
MSLSLTWGGPHPLYGHALCKIKGYGNEPTAEGCVFGSQSWAYWMIKNASSSWMSVPVGQDGGENCWNRDPFSWDGHYCAANGDLIGYVYGAYDPETYAAPQMRTRSPTFDRICSANGEGGASDDKRLFFPKIMNTVMLPADPHPDEPIYFNLTDNRTGYPVRKAVIGVYSGVVAVTSPFITAETNYTGEASITINKRGIYTVSISGTPYPNENLQLNVTATTTTTSTTTTSTTSTTTSTTILTGPEHFINRLTTSTTSTSTTEPGPAITGAAVADAGQDDEGGIIGWLKSVIGW